MKIRRWQYLALILTVLWLFVRGVSLEPMVILGELLLGGVIGLSIAYMLRRLYSGEVDLSRGVKVLPQSLVYIVSFLKELVVANLGVAYQVLHPSMPIEPAVIYMPLRVERPSAVTTIANSITLTPGTLTMDYDEEGNALYVHTIDGRDPEEVIAPIRRWEDLALVIFGEDVDPSDPAPEIRVGGDADD